MHIEKSIPVGGGLGGGSSDAAAVLMTLPKLWSIPVSHGRLESLALQLGSDVPFFLHEGSAYATGRGEVLQYRSLNIPYWIVLVTPNISINTAWAYHELSKRKAKTKPRVHSITIENNFNSTEIDFRALSNDFEEVVISSYPKVGEVKAALLEYGAYTSLMSGSGSSVFGLFGQEENARRAMDALKDEYFVSITEPNFIPPKEEQ